MSNAIISQVSKNLPFHYRLVCHRVDPKVDVKPTGFFELPEKFVLPYFGEFEGQRQFADVRVGWHEKGLYVSANIEGKKQSLWCRETQLMESDGLQLWIDTRDTHNIHRASKFCHWMLLMPTGGGGDKSRTMTSMLKINRAKEDSPNINRAKVDLASKVRKDGYKISAFIPAECLHGWDPVDHRTIGFNYAVVDRELGWQTLAIGPELPVAEDPSLWQSLSLAE